jgi:chloride channel 3/4/5
LLGFVLLGIIGGLYGAAFCKLNIAWSRHVRRGTRVKAHPILEVAAVAALTAIVSFFNPWTKMGGTELVSELFTECHAEATSALCISHAAAVKPLLLSLLTALGIKILLTVITYARVDTGELHRLTRAAASACDVRLASSYQH